MGKRRSTAWRDVPIEVEDSQALRVPCRVDHTNELLAAEINALPERVRRWIHILESNADPAGDKWRLLAAEQNIAGLTAEIERLRALTEAKK